MLLSAVSVLVVAQSSSEVPEGLMNKPVRRIKGRLLKSQLLHLHFSTLITEDSIQIPLNATNLNITYKRQDTIKVI